jgi:hypothetical protein
MVEIPYRREYDIGVGLLRSTGDAKSLAVKGAITSTGQNPGLGDPEGGFTYHSIHTNEELEQHLGIC